MLSTTDKPASTAQPHTEGTPVNIIPSALATTPAASGFATPAATRQTQPAERLLSFPQATPLNTSAANLPSPNVAKSLQPTQPAAPSSAPTAACVLPEGVKFTGSAFFPCDIQINGEVDGEIKAAPQKTITVSSTGSAKGNLQATNVRVDGKADGLVKAEGGLASFGTSARVSGEVVYGRVSIAEGAEIEASMKKASAIGR